MGFFIDTRRENIRKRTKVGFLTDFFFASEVTDYKNLRIVFHTFLGLICCSCLYYFGWKALNFADFDYSYGLIVKWLMIGLATAAFAGSPIFRCAFFCILLGTFGKQGQLPFTMLVITNLQGGPILNIVDNFEHTSNIVMCHLELQTKIVTNRISLLTGPIEEVVDKLVDKGATVVKRLVREIRELIAPFLHDLTDEDTKEDEIEEEEIMLLEKTEKRKEKILKLWEKSLNRTLTTEDEIAKELLPADLPDSVNATTQKPFWKKMKTDLVKKIAQRLSKTCETMFSQGVAACRSASTQITETCRDVIFWPLEVFICPKLSADKMCDNVERRVQSTDFCRANLQNETLDPSAEQDIEDVVNLVDDLDVQATAEVHTRMVQAKRVEIEYRLSDMKMKITTFKEIFKGIISILQQIVQTFFIFFIYQIFRDSITMIRKYNEDVEFNNSFLTSQFWAIDRFRAANGETHLTYLTKNERREWNVMEVFSFPTSMERKKALRPFFRWFVLACTVLVVVFVDYYYFEFIADVVHNARSHGRMNETSSAKIQVSGQGMVADFLKTVVNINKTVEIDQSLSNEHCLAFPSSPDTEKIVFWLILPLLFSFLLQVVFSFALRRIILNYFLPFMFPRRARVRLIYFYNKLLMQRENHRRECRSRIRFMAEKWNVQANEHNSPQTFFKTQILDRLFRTSKCLMCQEKARPRNLLYCKQQKCKAAFCAPCIDDNHGYCYACLVTKKEVTSLRSQFNPVTERNESTSEKRTEQNFVRYLQS